MPELMVDAVGILDEAVHPAPEAAFERGLRTVLDGIAAQLAS